jgi:ankyrin repeat protein
MCPIEARCRVEQLDLVGPCHGNIPGDLDRVAALFSAHPWLVDALNALDPAQMEETPQGAAAHLFCREILLLMLARGVRLDLFMACALGNTAAVDGFLTNDPVLANARGAHGIHVLNHAVTPMVARLLLDRGADPNQVVYEPWGWTPMHEAASRGKLALVELFAAAGGNIDSDSKAITPLHAAARMGHREVVEWLVSRGARQSACGPAGPWPGKTALFLAEENGHTTIARYLCQHSFAVRAATHPAMDWSFTSLQLARCTALRASFYQLSRTSQKQGPSIARALGNWSRTPLPL